MYKNVSCLQNNEFEGVTERELHSSYKLLSENAQRAGAALNNIQNELYYYTLVLEPMLERAETLQSEYESAVNEVEYLRCAIMQQDQILQTISDRVMEFADVKNLVVGRDGRTFVRPHSSREDLGKKGDISKEATQGNLLDTVNEMSEEKEEKEENFFYNRTLMKMLEKLKYLLSTDSAFSNGKNSSVNLSRAPGTNYRSTTAGGAAGRGAKSEEGNGEIVKVGRISLDDLATRPDGAGISDASGNTVSPTSAMTASSHLASVDAPCAPLQLSGSRPAVSTPLQKGDYEVEVGIMEGGDGGIHQEERLFHPCLRVYGDCNFKSSCSYAGYPYEACLSFLKGRCRFGRRCHEPHMEYTGPLPLVSSAANDKHQGEVSTLKDKS